jgi:ribosomal protein L12E/L44/L45/RPP1/RPP2
MALDTKMSLNSPDEGLVGGASVREEAKKGKRKSKVTEMALKVRLENRKGQLNMDRLTWWPNWLDLGTYFRPYRGRWFMGDAVDTNKGWRRNWQIVDSTPLITNNICAAGLLAGTASPSRPWFGYEFDDDNLMEAAGVRDWLAAITKVNRDILSQSNFYNALFECLGEYGVFGIMGLGREWGAVRDPTEADLPSFNAYTIGSYYIANDKKRRVNTFFRDFRWTVNQIVDKFGFRGKSGKEFDTEDEEFWVNISLRTRGLWESRQRDIWVDLVHAIEENIGRQVGKLGPAGMRFRSTYYERGGEPDVVLYDSTNGEADANKALRVAGFRDFPVFCARWYTNSEDAWGRGWAMDALGDARALQLQQRRKAQAIDKLVDPPMVADAGLRNQRTSLLSGDTTFIAPEANSIGFKPAYEIRPDLNGILADIKETQERIKSIGYADIFAMFIQAEQTGQPITAAEVNAKQQEKLLMLGPVLEQMNYDLFNPLHEWLFAEAARHGKYPPPPKAINKTTTLRVKYVSILAQAIQAITAQSIEKFSGFVGGVLNYTQAAAQNPALDKVNIDEMIEEYGKAMGIPPHIVRSDADVATLRQHREQQQQAQAQQQAEAQDAKNAQAHAKTGQLLSQTPTNGGQNTALDQLQQSVGAGRV